MEKPRLFPSKLAGITLTSEEFWRENVGGGWATAAFLLLLLAWKLLGALARRRALVSVDPSSNPTLTTLPNPNTSTGNTKVISDADLRDLINELEGKHQERLKWEDVIDKKNGYMSYNAKCCRPKEGPLKYLSITVFEKCSPELLRDFYMDNEYRKEWDKTLVEYEQLQVDDTCGTEIGRLVKKFPLLMPREYVLAWRVWEGEEKTFYCLIKDCEHSLAPRQKKYVRVSSFRSGWHIRKVPGRDACEISVVHQEDGGMNVEMAKLAFAKGIWSYVCKMNNALREYSPHTRSRSPSVATMHRLIQKVPPALMTDAGPTTQRLSDIPASSSSTGRQATGTGTVTSERRLLKKPSKKWITNGLLLVGGIVCLSRGRTTLGTQLAMACILKKLMKHGPASAGQVEPAHIARAGRECRHSD